MQKEKVREYDVVIEQDENKVYVAHVPELPGCHTEGDTLEEVMENIKEAVELYLEYTKEKVENFVKIITYQKRDLELLTKSVEKKIKKILRVRYSDDPYPLHHLSKPP